MSQLPPAAYVSVAVRGPWWTDEEPSLRVPRASGEFPVSIWTTGEGPDVLLVAPDEGAHDLWSPLSPLLGDSLTVHALDRFSVSFADEVDQVRVAADAVGAEFLAGFADDLALLRDAGRRASSVRRVLVLTGPGEASAGAPLDPGFMSCIEMSSRAISKLTPTDAQRIIDNLTEGGRRP